MVENQFSIGDLVAHKHYPGIAIGHITKFFPSGRVGISGDRARSFLPKNLVLVKELPAAQEKKLNLTKLPLHVQLEMLGDDDDLGAPSPASPTPPIPPLPPAQVQVEDVTEHPENCSQCGSQDIRRFHYHNPNKHYFYCCDCGHEGWRSEKLPPAQVEKELEVMEVPPETFDCCPECGGNALTATPLGVNWQTNPDYYLVLCDNCTDRWWFPDKVPASLMPDVELPSDDGKSWVEHPYGIVELKSQLPPIPRDFSKLGELPEWWESPILPNFERLDFSEKTGFSEYDDEDVDWLEDTGYFTATYRSWKLVIWETSAIYATPPSGDRVFHCECELELDGQDGQIAIAQEFIDNWYFAQTSPGQLNLNIPEAVARDPPPRFR